MNYFFPEIVRLLNNHMQFILQDVWIIILWLFFGQIKSTTIIMRHICMYMVLSFSFTSIFSIFSNTLYNSVHHREEDTLSIYDFYMEVWGTSG